MKDDLLAALRQIAEHPATYGFASGVARWLIGDRQGGWWVFLGYIASSGLVAWGASLYLADEALSPTKQLFFVLLVAFVARDLLNLLLIVVEKAKDDPLAFFQRLLSALRGGGAK